MIKKSVYFFLMIMMIESFSNAADVILPPSMTIESFSNAADVILHPIRFSGGIDLKNICTDISDERACDQSNLINDQQGIALKRLGSKRYIDQAVSSHPITSLYRAYASTTTNIIKAIIVTSGDKIYFSTTDAKPSWKIARSGLRTHNQKFSYTMIDNQVIMTGDALTDPIFKFNVIDASMTPLLSHDGSTTTINIRAKYVINYLDRLVAGNVMEISSDTALAGGTTHYLSRVYYSLLFAPSSFTVQRFIPIREGDGEQVTGLSLKFGRLEAYKQSSITEIFATILNLSSLGGDIVVTPLISGFGCVAPFTLQNTGDWDIFLSKDGIVLWDGGRRSRLNLIEEKRFISTNIEPLVRKTIERGTFKKSVGFYYPKRQWYLWSFEDPDKFPRSANNSVLVFDLVTGEWYPFKNWLVDSWTSFNGIEDRGELVYGDSTDGYVYLADLPENVNDARKEILLDTMDSTAAWSLNANVSLSTKVEGAGSLYISMSPSILISSMSRIAIFRMDEWQDKSNVNRADKISFKVFPTTIGNIESFRLDLQVEASTSASFNQNFSSVTFSSGALTAGETAWTTIEVLLSSFAIRNEWVDLTSETLTSARNLTYFGIRFISTAVGSARLNFDDVRLVQSGENPLNAFRLSKAYNFGSLSEKDFRQLILTREKSASSSLFIDVFSDFNQQSNTINLPQQIGKEIYVCNFSSVNGLAKVSSLDFSLLDSTGFAGVETVDFTNGVADDKSVYVADDVKNRIFRIEKSSMNVFISSFGTLGTDATSFDTIHQIAISGDNLILSENGNNRIKKIKKERYEFVQMFGTLGSALTSLHSPTGLASDLQFVWVADDGNNRIAKFTVSTFGFVSEIKLETGEIADTTLAIDNTYLYVAYNKTSDKEIYFQDVILEKRLKSDMSLVSRTNLRPKDVISDSTYTLRGNVALLGDFIFVSFTEDISLQNRFFIQKLLKSDFALVKEYRSLTSHFSVVGDGSPFEPELKTEKIALKTPQGVYLQLRFYEKDLDNRFKLFSQSFVRNPRAFRE